MLFSHSRKNSRDTGRGSCNGPIDAGVNRFAQSSLQRVGQLAPGIDGTTMLRAAASVAGGAKRGAGGRSRVIAIFVDLDEFTAITAAAAEAAETEQFDNASKEMEPRQPLAGTPSSSSVSFETSANVKSSSQTPRPLTSTLSSASLGAISVNEEEIIRDNNNSGTAKSAEQTDKANENAKGNEAEQKSSSEAEAVAKPSADSTSLLRPSTSSSNSSNSSVRPLTPTLHPLKHSLSFSFTSNSQAQNSGDPLSMIRTINLATLPIAVQQILVEEKDEDVQCNLDAGLFRRRRGNRNGEKAVGGSEEGKEKEKEKEVSTMDLSTPDTLIQLSEEQQQAKQKVELVKGMFQPGKDAAASDVKQGTTALSAASSDVKEQLLNDNMSLLDTPIASLTEKFLEKLFNIAQLLAASAAPAVTCVVIFGDSKRPFSIPTVTIQGMNDVVRAVGEGNFIEFAQKDDDAENEEKEREREKRRRERRERRHRHKHKHRHGSHRSSRNGDGDNQTEDKEKLKMKPTSTLKLLRTVIVLYQPNEETDSSATSSEKSEMSSVHPDILTKGDGSGDDYSSESDRSN
ncbi:uncharacterized protein MONOS_2714 [Monocercomonoides exilis]|uniref:uncharacterized protein n=1 Tax=Monocercomonoides exilis TaxID=2049356 RepID=UPI00355A9901|nr:hypothetical protein MONOS_2714 [Monocercomonoides exilis]|eukprot:MONOS_2714.1-p1 / transcript=MONOS_2714.1 / gene=MONOS_2714 / organism=Monocercomonoides_exilis_PA203 / gene_product=unspecified product / transcript_product=unspecified product / location=Mono_scaffold00057:77306-79243(-) / protein_length=571 / sequence_SO=supercontig / SO=protein_coding / is_pseudo=false